MSEDGLKRLTLYLNDEMNDGKLIQRWADELSEDCHGLDVLIIAAEGYPSATYGYYRCFGRKDIKTLIERLRQEYLTAKEV